LRKYTSIFAGTEHQPITSMKQMNRYDNVLGFYLNGQVIGTGRLERRRRRARGGVVNTSSTEIFKKYRNKGHGIHLYIALIETARRLGAKQIRSDTALNKFSRRMWKEKLAKIYPVKVRNTRRECDYCETTGPHRVYFYINLRAK
jgi:GNAT superfamily N-acetyltransferase